MCKSLTGLWYSCLPGVNSSWPQNICFLLSFAFWDSLQMNLLFLDCPEMFLKHLFGEFIYFCSLEQSTWLLVIGTTLMNIKTEASFSLKSEQRLRLTWVDCILFMKKNILKVTTAYIPYKKHFLFLQALNGLKLMQWNSRFLLS